MSKTTFRKVVDVPRKAAVKKFKEIKNTKHPQTTLGKAGKAAELSGLVLSAVIAWAVKTGMFDNAVTRKLEKVYSKMNVGKNKEGQDKKISSFIKKHPEFSSYATWWLAILMLIGVAKGGKFIQQNWQEKEEVKKEKKISINKRKNYLNSYKDFKETMHPLTKSIMLDMVFKEGTEKNEEGMCVPYKDGKGIWTIGFGLTVLDGESVAADTKPITMARAWKESIKFLEDGETYFFMWCYTVGLNNFSIDTPNKACALASIIYNSGTKLIEKKEDTNSKERNNLLRDLYKSKGDAVSAKEVKALFEKYPPVALTSFGNVLNKGGSVDEWADALGGFLKEGGGLYWRRWIEGQIAKGNISAEDLLQMPWLGGYDFFAYMGGDKTPFFSKDNDNKPKINDETLQNFKSWLQNPVDGYGKKIERKTLKRVLSDIDSTAVNQIKKGNAEFIRLYSAKIDTISLADALAIQAEINFNSKNYSEAINFWAQTLKLEPRNVQIMDNMVVAYNKLGEYSKAIDMVKQIEETGDETQLKSAYYNMGMAYEGLGDTKKAIEAYQRAADFGNNVASKKTKELQKIACNRSMEKLQKQNNTPHKTVWKYESGGHTV